MALTEPNVVLQSHLDAEERTIVPLAAVTLTQQEWVVYMKAELPAPIRLLFPLLIQRPWNRYKDTLLNVV